MSVDDVFTFLRSEARSHNLRISELARSVVDGTVSLPLAAGQSV